MLALPVPFLSMTTFAAGQAFIQTATQNAKPERLLISVCCWNHKSKAGIAFRWSPNEADKWLRLCISDSRTNILYLADRLANRRHTHKIEYLVAFAEHRHKLHKLHFHVQNSDGSSPASPSLAIAAHQHNR